MTLNRRVRRLIEVKTSDGQISKGLAYYADKLRPEQAIQLVLHLDRAREKQGIKVRPLGQWLESLAA